MFRCQNRSVVLVYILGFLKEGTVTSHYCFLKLTGFVVVMPISLLGICKIVFLQLLLFETIGTQSKFLERNQTHEIRIVNYKANEGH